MKFKTIFILFNVVVVLSFGLVFVAPLFVFDAAFSGLFLAKNWPLAAVLVLMLLALNLYFVANWKLFTLLEREDWPALSEHLSRRIMGPKARYGSREVKLYVNTLLLLSDLPAISRLEDKLGAGNPRLLEREALLFGIAWILQGDSARAESFLAPFENSKRCEEPEWLRFDLSFARALQRKNGLALAGFSALAKAKAPVVRALSAHFCHRLGPGEANAAALEAVAAETRAAFRSSWTPARWRKEIEACKAEIHGIILARLLDEAEAWIFAPSSPEAGGATGQAEGSRE